MYLVYVYVNALECKAPIWVVTISAAQFLYTVAFPP